MKIRTSIVTALTALGSLALLVPPAHAAGEVCYSVQATVNGSDVVNESACHTLP